ncbi:MAG: immune inhibitor A, partial [Candidatus Krumholzibacteria bacterium]|nr:immune inhibitor A [Candidatus Krumholzibacteria bacterium]
ADYLHATYVVDDVGLGAVIGVPNSAVGFGFAFDIQGGSGANNQAYPSEMDPLAPAQTAFIYNDAVPGGAVMGDNLKKQSLETNAITSSGTAGLSVDNGTYRMVYFAFGFEAISASATRTALMGRVLDWLQGYPEIAHTPLGDTEETANAYRVAAVITSDYFTLDPATFAVVYDVGSGPLSVPMTATAAPDQYEGFIPPQQQETVVDYYITASDVEGHTSTHPLGAPLYWHTFNVAKDIEPPVVAHVAHSNTNDMTGPYRIKATATDNIGIQCLYLIYWRNSEIAHRVKMTAMNGNGANGEYDGLIPGPSEVGDIYNYYILAMDASYSGNVTRVPETGAHAFEIVEEFVWDFEQDDGGFVQTGDIWEWGAPTSGPGAAHSGVNVWATVLDGDYPSSMDATLDIPPITLDANKPFALFSFWHWYNFETRYDGGNVKVSSDGGATWTIVTPVGLYDETASTANAGIPGERCFSGNMGGYTEEIFDLSAYAGQSLMFRFHAGSDGSVQRDGWYVDYVTLRSTDVDDVPPVISDVNVPGSTFDTAGPYPVSCTVTDLFSGVDVVTLHYSTDDGVTWTQVAMTGAGDDYDASIPGQPNGTRIQLYVSATDLAANETLSDTYGFSILPSADILVMVSATTGVSLDDFRAALEANGHEADYWNMSSQGSEILNYLTLYDKVILDERSSISTTEKTAYSDFLTSAGPGAKKGFFIMGRDLGYYSSTRPWIAEWMRADYVQDNPAWYELTGEPGEPIGAEETFVISGSYPDEVERSETYPGGEIVYRYTGPGSAALSREEIQGAYDKAEKEWDGVMPHAPKSLDAAAGIKYAGEQYRSVYFSFNFYYVQEPVRRAGIM